MNYLNKHNPIGDVDMIRILERLDRGMTTEEVLLEVSEENHDEARELLETIRLLDEVREVIVPPREHLQQILVRLNAPFEKSIEEEARDSRLEKSTHTPKYRIFPLFPLRHYFFPVSVGAIAVLLVVAGRSFIVSPIGTDAVLYELGTENLSEIFPDDQVIQITDKSDVLSVPVTEQHFDMLTEDTTGLVVSATAPAEDAGRAATENIQAPVPLNISRSGTLYANPFEATIVPLTKNETQDAYGVFPEDDFSIYLKTLTDMPIDNY